MNTVNGFRVEKKPNNQKNKNMEHIGVSQSEMQEMCVKYRQT